MRTSESWCTVRAGCEHPENEGCHKCCGSCNFDVHRCPGCGEHLPHGVGVCVDCSDELSSHTGGEVPLNIEMFRQLADGVSQLSMCQRRKVGAVLVDVRNGQVLGTGHNNGWECKTSCPRGRLSYDEVPTAAPHVGSAICFTRHAEIDALDDAGTTGGTASNVLMIVNHTVCSDCSAILAGLGIPFLEVDPL